MSKPLGAMRAMKVPKCIVHCWGHIQNKSNAELAYQNSIKGQVEGGIGYFRLITDYIDSMSFDQEILIDPIYDPLSVKIDPQAKLIDKSDMDFAFVYEELDKDIAEELYPQFKDYLSQSPLGDDTFWVREGIVVIADYYRRVHKKVKIVQFSDPETKQAKVMKLDDIPQNLRKVVKERGRERWTTITTVEKMTIIGNEIAEPAQTIPGKWIPIIPVIGEETIIEGVLDRKGHTRNLVDQNKMYNYWTSAGVEYGALQTKTPWTGPMETFEEFGSIWKTANQYNWQYLPYKQFDEDGNKLDSPQRIDPPVAAPVALTGMEIARAEMQAASGQFTANMGETDNSRTGSAIQSRQVVGDTATSHFLENFILSLTHAGRIIMQWVPIYYDTERMYLVTGGDGEEFMLKINPEMKNAYAQEMNERGEIINRMFNPNVGEYELKIAPGVNNATKREKAFQAFTVILTQAPDLIPIIGDILFRASDFPLADEAAKRLRRMVPKDALGEGPSQNEQMMQQQIGQLQNVMKMLMQELTKEKLKAAGLQANKNIEAYKAVSEFTIDQFKAFTDRLKVIADAEKTGNISREEAKVMIRDAMKDVIDMDISEPLGLRPEKQEIKTDG